MEAHLKEAAQSLAGTLLFFYFLYLLNLAHPAFRDSTLMTSKTDTAFYLLHVSPYSKDPLATANLTNTSQGYTCVCGKCRVSVGSAGFLLASLHVLLFLVHVHMSHVIQSSSHFPWTRPSLLIVTADCLPLVTSSAAVPFPVA